MHKTTDMTIRQKKKVSKSKDLHLPTTNYIRNVTYYYRPKCISDTSIIIYKSASSCNGNNPTYEMEST